MEEDNKYFSLAQEDPYSNLMEKTVMFDTEWIHKLRVVLYCVIWGDEYFLSVESIVYTDIWG